MLSPGSGFATLAGVIVAASFIAAVRKAALTDQVSRGGFCLPSSKALSLPGSDCPPRRCLAEEVLAMPRYFFHVKRGLMTILDREGIELTGVEEAAKEAAQQGQQIARREALTGIPPSGGTIIVDDDGSQTIFELAFETVASHQPRPA